MCIGMHTSMAQSTHISGITIKGNKSTKNYIFYREIVFAKGDSVLNSELISKLEQSRLNLLNTSLFNFVTIKPIFSDSLKSEVVIEIEVQERWYIWPKPVLQIADRNFNVWWSEKDFSRLNYGIVVDWNNFSGRMDMLSVMLQEGKSRQWSLAYFNPFLDKQKRIGAGIMLDYIANNEIGIQTINDKLIYLSSDSKLIKTAKAGIMLSYKNSVFYSHQLNLSFQITTFNDSVLKVNPNYSYTNQNELSFFRLHYKFKIDYRDIHYYPLKGWYTDVELSKYGLGFKFEKTTNVAWIKTTSRVYIPIRGRWYAGAALMTKLSSSLFQPYYFIQGLGYGREFVRGYQYNVVDGKHFVVIKTTAKYAIVPEKEVDLKEIDVPKFTRFHYAVYLTLFADAGFVSKPEVLENQTNNLPGSWLSSVGLGVDFVTYYDKVLRFEYAINKSVKSGFFIHFISGI